MTRILAISFIVFFFGKGPFKQDEEYLLKAHFIEKITFFVKWPGKENTINNSAPFKIAVFGKNRFDKNLESVFNEKEIKNRNVIVQYIHSISQIEGNDIVFISDSEYKSVANIVEYTKNKPVLLIGDTEGYGEEGIHINFYLKNEQIRFEINMDAIEKSELIFDYKLLRLARKI